MQHHWLMATGLTLKTFLEYNKRMKNIVIKTVDDVVESIKRLNGSELDELCEKLVAAGMGDKIEFLLSVHTREKQNEL